MREQLIEEVNIEGDEIISECNKLIESISKSSETSNEQPEKNEKFKKQMNAN